MEWASMSAQQPEWWCSSVCWASCRANASTVRLLGPTNITTHETKTTVIPQKNTFKNDSNNAKFRCMVQNEMWWIIYKFNHWKLFIRNFDKYTLLLHCLCPTHPNNTIWTKIYRLPALLQGEVSLQTLPYYPSPPALIHLHLRSMPCLKSRHSNN